MYGLVMLWPDGREERDPRSFRSHHEALCAGRRWLRKVGAGANFMVAW